MTVIQLLPALEAGGVERGVVEVVGALAERGHRADGWCAHGRATDRAATVTPAATRGEVPRPVVTDST